jgi:hypothetical protein
MDFIKNNKELQEWLVNYITDSIHGFEAEDSAEFNKWAKNFQKEEAEFVVNMEFGNDWGYDERKEITLKEAKEYANTLMKKILENWYL